MDLRAARPGDYPAFARLFDELAIPDQVPAAEAWCQHQAPNTLVAQVDGKVAGFLWSEVVGDSLYIRQVVSDPRARRRGIGRALMLEALRQHEAAGLASWRLNVKDDNAAAIGLYESLGLRTQYASRVVHLPWGALASDVPPRLTLRVPQAAEDASLEKALGLLDGHLARLRASDRVLVLADDEAGQPAGIAAFDPAFPGAFPFRARDLGVCAALLGALEVHRRPFPGGGWRASALQLVIERDEALAEALLQHGASPLFRILHLCAPFPAPDPRNRLNTRS
jgi:GNAT superfamily N-acetyltransferase